MSPSEAPGTVEQMADLLRLFFGPVLATLKDGGTFSGTWKTGEPWR